MKIRLMGTRRECDYLVDALRDLYITRGLALRSVSPFYPNRGETIEGRVYVEVE